MTEGNGRGGMRGCGRPSMGDGVNGARGRSGILFAEAGI